jgi:Uma2 family endonuclease
LAFDSSAGFRLPNGAVRAADAAWIRRERWDALTPEQRRAFAPLCPDFVVELKSPSDSLKETQDKLEEFLENGAQLGWLIDPDEHRVHVYRPGQRPVVLKAATEVDGNPVLPGFVLSLELIWSL